jgi:hypothetical protein
MPAQWILDVLTGKKDVASESIESITGMEDAGIKLSFCGYVPNAKIKTMSRNIKLIRDLIWMMKPIPDIDIAINSVVIFIFHI